MIIHFVDSDGELSFYKLTLPEDTLVKQGRISLTTLAQNIILKQQISEYTP